MRKILYIILGLIFIYNCHNSTGPEKKDPRELFWSVDTLLYPESAQTMMGRIWGSSANDVYTVGDSFRNTLGTMYHYNGEEWQPVPLSFHDGGSLKGIYCLQDVHGFSSNNVYAVGWGSEWESKIIHYDGNSWRDIDIPRKGFLFCIYGDAPDNIWAAGNRGTIFHYDGEEWLVDSLNYSGDTTLEVYQNGFSITGDSVHGYYLWTYTVKEGMITIDFLFQNIDEEWCLVDSGYEYQNGINEIWMSPSGNLYKTNYDGVYKWKNGNWHSISEGLEKKYNYIDVFGIHGTSDENIFITARQDGYRVFHYNGSDWYEYKQLHTNSAAYFNIFTIEGEVFVTGYTTDGFPNKTVIWHGK